jgi:Phytanoyl-CoA dioxygenase (PhyH)
MLSRSEIDQFIELGYVRVEEAFPRRVAFDCTALAMQQLEIPASAPWPEPVVRGVVNGQPFHQAANAVRLLEAVDQLLEGEAWLPRPNLGLVVIRLPSRADPGDTGWHIDASFQGPTTDTLYDWYVNYRSRGRGLLLLCLLSDISVEDAPTRILEGSHHAIPPLLRPFGEDGVLGLSAPLPDPDGPVVSATGLAGDVYLCHPFLVHAASWPHVGSQPRLIAQPPIALEGALRLETADQELSPVALTVRRALDI